MCSFFIVTQNYSPWHSMYNKTPASNVKISLSSRLAGRIFANSAYCSVTTPLCLLQEVVLVGQSLQLNPCDGARWTLPEEASVRIFHKWKCHLHHEPTSCCGC